MSSTIDQRSLLMIKPDVISRARKHKGLIRADLSGINERIKSAEEFLQNHEMIVDAKVGELQWSHKKQRIVCAIGGELKPFGEHKLEIRIAHHEKLEELIEAVVEANEASRCGK